MERKYTINEFVEALKNIELVNPAHLDMTSNGHGEFPDGYKLKERGAEYLKKELEGGLNK